MSEWGRGYPGSSPLELVLFVLQLVAQRLLLLLQLRETFLQLEGQRGVVAPSHVLQDEGSGMSTEATIPLVRRDDSARSTRPGYRMPTRSYLGSAGTFFQFGGLGVVRVLGLVAAVGGICSPVAGLGDVLQTRERNVNLFQRFSNLKKKKSQLNAPR